MASIGAPEQGRSVRPPHKSVKNHIDQSNDLIRHPSRSKLMQKPLSPFLTDRCCRTDWIMQLDYDCKYYPSTDRK